MHIIGLYSASPIFFWLASRLKRLWLQAYTYSPVTVSKHQWTQRWLFLSNRAYVCLMCYIFLFWFSQVPMPDWTAGLTCYERVKKISFNTKMCCNQPLLLGSEKSTKTNQFYNMDINHLSLLFTLLCPHPLPCWWYASALYSRSLPIHASSSQKCRI